MSIKKSASPGDEWTDWQVSLLEQNIDSMPVKMLADLIGRTEAAVQIKASRLGLEFPAEDTPEIALAEWKYSHRMQRKKWDDLLEKYSG